MVAFAEADVRIRVAIELNAVRLFEYRLVTVRRGPANRDSATGFQRLAIDVRIAGNDPSDLRKR